MPIVKLFKRRTRRRRRTCLKNVGYLNNFCNFRLFSFCLNVSTSVNMEEADSTHQHEGGCAPDPHVFKANGGTGGSPASPTLRFLFFPFFLLLLLFFFRLWWWGDYFQGTSTRFLINLTPTTSSQPHQARRVNMLVQRG